MSYSAFRPTPRDRLLLFLAALRNLLLSLPLLLLMLPVLGLALLLALVGALFRLPEMLDNLLPPELHRPRR